MWWYNIIGYSKEIISDILRLDPINAVSILIAANLVTLKGGNTESILTVKIVE